MNGYDVAVKSTPDEFIVKLRKSYDVVEVIANKSGEVFDIVDENDILNLSDKESLNLETVSSAVEHGWKVVSVRPAVNH